MDAGQAVEIGKLIADGGLGAISLALFFKLGQVVANHEIRLSKAEDNIDEIQENVDDLRVVRRKRRRAR